MAMVDGLLTTTTRNSLEHLVIKGLKMEIGAKIMSSVKKIFTSCMRSGSLVKVPNCATSIYKA